MHILWSRRILNPPPGQKSRRSGHFRLITEQRIPVKRVHQLVPSPSRHPPLNYGQSSHPRTASHPETVRHASARNCREPTRARIPCTASSTRLCVTCAVAIGACQREVVDEDGGCQQQRAQRHRRSRCAPHHGGARALTEAQSEDFKYCDVNEIGIRQSAWAQKYHVLCEIRAKFANLQGLSEEFSDVKGVSELNNFTYTAQCHRRLPS